jgi:hypothetical protein
VSGGLLAPHAANERGKVSAHSAPTTARAFNTPPL